MQQFLPFWDKGLFAKPAEGHLGNVGISEYGFYFGMNPRPVQLSHCSHFPGQTHATQSGSVFWNRLLGFAFSVFMSCYYSFQALVPALPSDIAQKAVGSVIGITRLKRISDNSNASCYGQMRGRLLEGTHLPLESLDGWGGAVEKRRMGKEYVGKRKIIENTDKLKYFPWLLYFRYPG